MTEVNIPKTFNSHTCLIKCSEQTLENIKRGLLKLNFHHFGQKKVLNYLDIAIDAISGNINIFCGNDGAIIKLGKISGNFDIRT